MSHRRIDTRNDVMRGPVRSVGAPVVPPRRPRTPLAPYARALVIAPAVVPPNFDAEDDEDTRSGH